MTPGLGIGRTLLPKGFTASGVNSGVRRYRPDLGVIVSEVPAVTSAVFTLNECKAAPVLYSQNCLSKYPDQIRAIVTNSGQANAATGLQGVQNNLAMAQNVAQALECRTESVLTASTGTIGVQMEIDKIVEAVPELMERQGNTAESFALAILTTDLVPKTVSTEVMLKKGMVRITGISKGSGMIHPNMATMLGYFLTDAIVPKTISYSLIKKATDLSFNMISVDGECSTNDCVFFMANGMSRVEIETDEDLIKFQTALNEVAVFLAQGIARDGEGATKLIEVRLHGAPSEELARKAARGLVMSPLVKTAVHGEDPNWGRILARLGADSVSIELLNQMTLRLQDRIVFESGMPVAVDLKELKKELKADTVVIDIDLKSGSHTATAWGCDLSKKYVEINSEYST